MNKMKKIGRIYWMLLIILCTACNDPYEGDTFSVYDIQPAATYLSSRSGEFSEWISIMKYADLYNAVNQATQYFTLFVPTNEAVKAFYTKKGITSIEEFILFKIQSVRKNLSSKKARKVKKRFPMTSFRCLSAVLKMAAVVCNQSI